MLQERDDGVHGFAGGGVRVRENGGKVVLQHLAERIAIRFVNTQKYCQGSWTIAANPAIGPCSPAFNIANIGMMVIKIPAKR